VADDLGGKAVPTVQRVTGRCVGHQVSIREASAQLVYAGPRGGGWFVLPIAHGACWHSGVAPAGE
jgi:hypothetical protein